MREEAETLLHWYDHHARDLPWRIGPEARKTGVQPDPYRVWLSEIMLQQTTVPVVGSYFATFTTRWPRVSDLAGADDAEVMAAWAGLGYYARARNLLKCARVLRDEHGGRFPGTEGELLKLPGIGPYTAAAIASIAFDVPATVLDGNVERVMARYFAVTDPLPGSKEDLRRLAGSLTPDRRPGDYAQAVMDLGATICKPRNPACGICPLMPGCQARRQGIAADLPAKTPKAPKPVRHGIAYLARRSDGSVALERRAEKGLLGGMLGLPGTDWAENCPAPNPPFAAKWRAAGEIRHTFTHFHLQLQIMTIESDADCALDDHADLDPGSLPTVMRKAYLQGLAFLDNRVEEPGKG